MRNLIIIGASGHGQVVFEIACKIGLYDKILFLDDDLEKSNESLVVGTLSDIEKYLSTFEFFVAIGNNCVRKKIIEKLIYLGANMPTLIHPSAVVARNVEMGRGCVVMPGVVINPFVKIGDGVIVNTSSSIDHGCTVGNFCHIAVGSHVAGDVSIGNNSWIGAGATIINNLSICDNCLIGAGAVVVDDITNEGTYIGVPAKKYKGK
ncbi:MAG: acetyltransferase [Clostridiales bacterium]|nr:acetyltransferase [Clostridiales bacterium]